MRTVVFLQILAVTFLLTACGGGGGKPPQNQRTPPASSDVMNTFAYLSVSPYADDLRPCTYAGSATRECNLATLPFLGQDTLDPTIDDVLDRLLVSHMWMGDNFAAVLEQLPADVLLMLRSVTAVVVASDIRPSYFDPATGAIYLDADFLWLTAAEEATVSDAPDFRSEFGRDLQFHMPWRYVRDNERLAVTLNPDGSRDLGTLIPILGFLLYHELAHAVDFMSPDKMVNVLGSMTSEEAITSDSFLSTAWQGVNPLNSTTLEDLAAVSFLGEDASAAQQALLPDDLVVEFTSDGAIQYYAYSTQFEDFATTFETVMMMYHFDFEKDTGITTNTEFSNDAIVSWGQRGRLSDAAAYPRALAAVQTLYPGNLAPIETFLANLPPPIEMTPGITWGENLMIGSQTMSEPELSVGARIRDDILGRRPIM